MDFEKTAEEKMQKVIENLNSRFTTVRAGRANPAMLNGIMAECYGVPTLITSVANITVPEALQLFIKPFDRTLIKNIEKGINEANLGMTPTNNGETIILTIPELTEDRRREYVKTVKAMGEDARVGIRNARQDVNNAIKREEMPEDEKDMYLESIQELTNKYNKMVDDLTKEKENELMSV